MASRPKLRALRARMKELGGEDAVFFERVAAGDTLQSIADDLGVNRGMLHWYTRPVVQREKYAIARKLSAEARAEQGLAIIDSVAEDENGKQLDPTSAQVQAANYRAAYRLKLAAAADPEQYGDKKEAGVTINVQSLHLDALRSSGAMGREIEVLEPKQLPSE